MVLITKADGEKEPYNPRKLISSLMRAGAEEGVAQSIESDIEKELRPNITTQEVYRRAFAHLREHRHEVAARYSLKRAIFEFGPSGFPFEEYLAQLFIKEGYKAKVDQIIRGGCVEHEVDVVLERDSTTLYVEAKFHNTPGFKTDLKTALYVKARLEDIATQRRGGGTMEGLLVTNTKFTSQAIQFASCSGVTLLGWEYPQRGTLQDRIEKVGLYPVTALTTLNRREKMALLERKIVLCSELDGQEPALKAAGVSKERISYVLNEAAALCAGVKGLQ